MDGMRRVAVIVETSGHFGRELLRGIAHWAHSHTDWQLTIETGDATRSRLLPGWRGDGLIGRPLGPALAAAIAACDLPRVLLAHPGEPPPRQRHPQVQLPLWVGPQLGACAFAYLRSLGLDAFAYCDHPERGDYGRSAGFLAAAQAAGFAVPRWQPPKRGDPRQSLVRWLQRLPQPCGIWAANDDTGLHLIEVCRAAGIAVPGQAVILGCDDDVFLCELASPPLASVALATYAAGQEAARMLAEMIAGRRPQIRQLPEARIIPRASSEWSGCADPLTARAMARVAGPLPPTSSAELARGLGVSVRALERHVHAATGTTPGRLLRMQRLAGAQRLLATTELTVTAIAERCGYTSSTRLGEALKRATGLTPQAWRAAHA